MSESSIEDIFPLSPMQEGFLFESLYDPDSEAYFVQMNFRFRGELQPESFRETWQMLCARHGVLRSAFVHEGLSRPAQVVLRQRLPEIMFTDLRHMAPGERQQHIEQFQRQDRRRGFNLARDVLMRIAVFQTQSSEYHVLWSLHHILIDGWCLSILQREFVQVYSALIQGQTPDLPPVFPYGNYLNWLGSQDREEARRFWREYLSGYQGLASIPQMGSRDKDLGYTLQELSLELDSATTAALRATAARAGVTFNTLVQCVWAIVLARYNDRSEVVFGMIVSGRPPDLPGVEHMLGLCINAIPVRIQVAPDRSFIGLLQATQAAAFQCQRRHHLPLAEIQSQCTPGGQLFDHLLTFENYPVAPASLETDDSGATFVIEPLGAHDRTHYPFTFIATPGDKLHVRFSFNAKVYKVDQMRRTMEHFLTAIRSVLDNPNLSVGEVNILPASERQQVLHDFNDTRFEQAYDPGLVGRFEAQVERTPDQAAVVCEDRRLTYRELNERANLLAHYLRDEHHVQPDDRIGLWLDRSEHLPVAIWGILKAGAAYVPIDPENPPHRRSHMLADSACRLVVTEKKHAGQAACRANSAIVDIRCFPTGSSQNPPPVTSASHLAYVIYTSGSTGEPKGCQIELGNLVHYLCWANEFYFPGPEGGCFGLYTPLAFDLTVTSLYLPFLRGKTLHVFPANVELLDVFERTFRDGSAIDSIKLTPSHISLLRYMRLSRSNLRLAIVGGEALSLEQVRVLRNLNPQIEIYNEYGPTETTVGCVVKRMEDSDERVLIGRPIANTRIYIMRDGKPVPIGITGEVLIGGAGVGRGYINRDELNRRAFVEDPCLPGGRLYRTGDLGRWLPDGNLELLGRTDHQVKIRGYRIELGEIEHQLVRHVVVRDAVVMARDQNELVAYLTMASSSALNLEKLREHLTAVLPDYMIPSHFIQLDEFPLTPNGKVDRQALADLAAAGPGVDGVRNVAAAAEFVAPRNVHEERLLEIWRDVFELDRISVTDNFFRLGGHSLKAMQIASQIHKRLGLKVALRQVFQMPSIAGLASVVRSADRDAFVGIEPAPEREYYDLSHAQQRLWLLHQLDGAAAYNIPRAFIFDDALHVEALNQAFRTLIERHEALRTAFVLVDGEPKQKILASTDFRIDEVDLRGREQPEKLARQYVDELANTPFDLAQPPLLRAALVRLADRRFVFAFNLHHIIGDGWSENIFYREVMALYDACRFGRPNPLRPLRIQYKDFTVWQNRLGFQRDEQYWLGKLSNMPDGIRLPYDAAPENERDFLGGTETVVLPATLTAALREFAAGRATTLSNVVLAVFKLFLFQWTRQDDICVGMSVANRNHPDTESLIGFFVNLLPIRTRMSADMEFDDLLQQVERTCHEAFEHQDYPFDLLVRKLNPTRFANRQTILNVVYNYLSHGAMYVDGQGNGRDSRFDTEGQTGDSREWKPFEYTFATSKFDLTLFVLDDEKNLHLTLEYDSGIFNPTTVRRGLATLQSFVKMVVGSAVEPKVAGS